MNFNNTNWHLYKTFILVYETGSMNQVAEILNVSRSAVSQSIKELGNQLGVALFIPHSKGVIPTGEANNLYPTIKNAITSIVEVENSLRGFDHQSEAVLKIGLTIPSIEYCVLDYLKEFCTKYPNVQLEFYRRDIMELLGSGKLDFVIEMGSVVGKHNFNTISLFDMNNTFIATKEFLKKHGLSQTISVDDLLRLPIISFHTWSDFYKQLNVKIKPKFVIKADSVIMGHYMAKNSMGISYYVKEAFQKMNDPDLVEVQVKNLSFPSQERVCGFNSLSRPAKTFVDGLKETLSIKNL